MAQAERDVHWLASCCRAHRELRGHWPGESELPSLRPGLPQADPWHRPFCVEVLGGGETLIVRSVGKDGVCGSCDDVVSRPVTARGSGAGQ